jgi:hypothetical protein
MPVAMRAVGDSFQVLEQYERSTFHFQSMLRQQSLPVHDECMRAGVWRMLTVRCFDMDLMLIATVALRRANVEHAPVIEQVKKCLLEWYDY